jgi:hypothetical protein
VNFALGEVRETARGNFALGEVRGRQLDLAIKLTLKPPEEGAKGGGEGNAP